MPINLNDFNRMKRAFERNGGQIDQSDEMQRYLLTRQAEGVTFNSKLIGLIREPTRSTIFVVLRSLFTLPNTDREKIQAQIFFRMRLTPLKS